MTAIDKNKDPERFRAPIPENPEHLGDIIPLSPADDGDYLERYESFNSNYCGDFLERDSSDCS